MHSFNFLLGLFLSLNLTLAIDLAKLTSSQVFSIIGSTNEIEYLFPIRAAGDVNKDGKTDIILGGYADSSAMESAFLIYGTSAWDPVNIDFSIPVSIGATTISTLTTADGFGSYVSGAGDINGDGYADFMVSASRKNSYQGEVYVVYGAESLSTFLDPSFLTSTSISTGFTISTTEIVSFLGNPVSYAGKINGDDYDDIAVSLTGLNSFRGAVVVIYGGLTSTLSDIQIVGPNAALNPSNAGFSIIGNAPGDSFGSSVSNIGDINKDGYDDILIGAPGKDGGKGAAYVIYGSHSPVNLDLLIQPLDPATTGFTILGNAVGDYFGSVLSSAGDVNKDGIPDIAIRAFQKDPNQMAVYIIYGRKTPADIDLSSEILDPATTGFIVKGNTDGAHFGNSIQCVGDLNKDGYSDLIIAEYGQRAVHVIYGGGFSDIDLSSVTLDPAKNGFTITGSSGFGAWVSSGNFDGDADGKIELFVSTAGKISSEPAGYIINLSKMCADNCNSCRVPSTCEVCLTNFELVISTLQCRECNVIGEYYSNHKCHSCSKGCLQCQDGSTCQVCANNYMLSDWNTCVEKKQDSKTGGSSAAFEGASLVGSSLTSGSSLSLNFGLVAKILRNVKYLDIPVSPELLQTFFSWKVTSSFLSAPKSWSSKSDSGVLPSVFSRYDLNPEFLVNYWKTLIMTLIGLIIFVIFKVLEMQNFKSSVARSINIAASNFALTQFYSNFDDVVFYLALDIRSTKFDTSLQVASFILGVVLLIVGFVIIGVHMWLLWKYQSMKEQNLKILEAFQLKYENINLLFKDFKDLTLLTQCYMLVNLIRCLISSMIFALFFEYPLLQILLLLTLNIGMIIYLLVKRSFKEILNTCGQFFCEVILLFANICMFVMCIFGEVGSQPLGAIESLSKCVIILNLLLLIGCVIFLALSVIKMLYKVYQEKKMTKDKIVEIAIPKNTLNNKLDGIRLSHPKRTSQMSHVEKTPQTGIQKVFQWNITDSNGIIQQNDGINHQDSFINDSKQFYEVSQGNISNIIQGEDFINTSNTNLVPIPYLTASPRKRTWKPKRGRIKMPGETMLKGYLDYQKRFNGESSVISSPEQRPSNVKIMHLEDLNN